MHSGPIRPRRVRRQVDQPAVLIAIELYFTASKQPCDVVHISPAGATKIAKAVLI